MAAQVFISYASADKAVAERVSSTLESAGITVWIAPRDIPPGTEFPAAIVEAVSSVRVLVLILTEHAVASPHILSEVGHAFNGKKRIVPFRLSRAPLPEDLEYFLSLTQWLDAFEGCTDQNLQRLTEATRAALTGDGSVRRTVRLKRQGKWVAAGMLALAVVVAAGTILLRRSPKPSGPDPTALVTASGGAAPSSVSKQKTWVNPVDGQQYVWIPPGSFIMGCSGGDSECADDEKPAHPVDIDHGFWLGQTEVTIAAYRRFAAKHNLKPTTGDGAFPVTGLTWAKAKEYCAAIGGRLPTEAEWEYAARAGDTHSYYGMVPKIAWYADDSGDTVHAVGGKQPNAFGLYDMLGNVKEWVLDRYYKKYYLDSATTGSDVDQPLASNATAVARGGFWASEAASIRVSHRFEEEPDAEDVTVGVRCASDHP
jgi:formylglycine-generating enzyme required for sulfatase activity